MYADDSALIVAGKNIADIQQTLTSQLESVREWLIDNKLSLHLGKTESILFGSKRRLSVQDTLQVSCAGNIISSKTCVKYIGLDIDQSLSGECIADKLVSRCNSKLKFLYRQARHFDLPTKRLLVSSLIQSHFDYASSSWFSGLTKTHQRRLQVMQNKVIRFLLNADTRTHIGPAQFTQVQMLPVELRVQQLKLNHMYNIFHNKAPSYLASSFTSTHNIHIINTRSSNRSFSIPHVKSFGHTSFRFTGARLWNQLPNHIQYSDSKSVFKSRVKQFLFHQMVLDSERDYVYLTL